MTPILLPSSLPFAGWNPSQGRVVATDGSDAPGTDGIVRDGAQRTVPCLAAVPGCREASVAGVGPPS